MLIKLVSRYSLILIGRLIVWKQLKIHNTFLISANWQHDLFFFHSIQFSVWLVPVYHAWTMNFLINAIVGDPFFINSDHSLEKKSQALLFKCVSQAMIRCDKWISFDRCETQISTFLTSPRSFLWFSIAVREAFICFAISRTILWRFNSVIAFILSSLTS